MITELISASGETVIIIVKGRPLHPSVQGVTLNSTVSRTLNKGLMLSNIPESNAPGAPIPSGKRLSETEFSPSMFILSTKVPKKYILLSVILLMGFYFMNYFTENKLYNIKKDKSINLKNKENSREYDATNPEFRRFIAIEDTQTAVFTELQQYNEELSEYEFPEKILFHKSSEEFSKGEEMDSNDILKLNINAVLSEFNEKEIYIMEHLFGLNNAEKMSSEQIAKNLGVTKVNITFTKNRVIRLMRHTSMSNQLLNGV